MQTAASDCLQQWAFAPTRSACRSSLPQACRRSPPINRSEWWQERPIWAVPCPKYSSKRTPIVTNKSHVENNKSCIFLPQVNVRRLFIYQTCASTALLPSFSLFPIRADHIKMLYCNVSNDDERGMSVCCKRSKIQQQLRFGLRHKDRPCWQQSEWKQGSLQNREPNPRWSCLWDHG